LSRPGQIDVLKLYDRMPDEAFHPEQSTAVLEPPRFSLRTLLLAMTALGCLFGLLTAVGNSWSLLILFFLSLATAHVLGNSLGTKLRDGSIHLRSTTSPTAESASEKLIGRELLTPSRLSQHIGPSRVTPVMAFVGAAAGAFVGGAGLAGVYPEAGAAAVTLGVVSSAILGGFAGFMASSFLSVMRSAWSEALRQPESRPPRPL
jgi:hypothetical protein